MGKRQRIQDPVDAIEAGIGFVTESRLTDGIFALLSVKENTSVHDLRSAEQLAGSGPETAEVAGWEGRLRA